MTTIRSIRDEDKTRWLELWRAYIEFYKTEIPDAQYELTWSRLRDDQLSCHGFVAEVDGDACCIVHYLFAPNDTARKLHDTYTAESGKVQYRIALPPA